LTLRGNPACEAAADRDPDTLLDLLLDPYRGAGDELVPLHVEQEHGARVDLERLLRADEEGGEQFVEIQVSESGVGQRLEPPESLSIDLAFAVHIFSLPAIGLPYTSTMRWMFRRYHVTT